ncbi:MAG: hypothetical protein FWE85_02530 [Clostridiales bacterium]|nr:hypothetical protein [Clostridiales bacterium]
MYETEGSNFGTMYPQPPLQEQPAPPPPGKGMIKVTGILMIIFGSLGVFFIGIAILFLSLLSEFNDMFADIAEIAPPSYALMVLSLAAAACMLAFGIYGVNNAGNAAKAQSIVYMGIILIAIAVIELIARSIEDGINGGSIFSLMIELVLPILFIVGGSRNKSSLQQ